MDYEVCKKNAIEALKKILEFHQKLIARVYNELSVPVRHDGRCTMYSAAWSYLEICGVKPEEDIKLEGTEAVKFKQKVYSDFEKINGKTIDSYKNKYGFCGSGSAFPHTEEQAKFAFALWFVMASNLGQKNLDIDKADINNKDKFGQWLNYTNVASALESYTGKKILSNEDFMTVFNDDEEIKNADGMIYLKVYSGIGESGVSLCGYTQPIKKDNIPSAAKMLNEVLPFKELISTLRSFFIGSNAGGGITNDPAGIKKVLELLTKNPELQKIINAILENNENQSDDLKKLAQEFGCVLFKYNYNCIGKMVVSWICGLLEAVASRKHCDIDLRLYTMLSVLIKRLPEDRRDVTEEYINCFIKTLKINLESDNNKIDQDTENELKKHLEDILAFKPEKTFMETIGLLEEFSKFFLDKFVAVADAEKLKTIESKISGKLTSCNKKGWLTDQEMQETISKIKKIFIEPGGKSEKLGDNNSEPKENNGEKEGEENKEVQKNDEGEHEQSGKSTDQESDHDKKEGEENNKDIHGQSGNNMNQESNQKPKSVEREIDKKDDSKERKDEIQTPAVTPTKKDDNKKDIKPSKFKSFLWWMWHIFLVLTIFGAYFGIRDIVNRCKEKSTEKPDSDIDANENKSNHSSKESIIERSSNLQDRAKEANETNIINSSKKKEIRTK